MNDLSTLFLSVPSKLAAVVSEVCAAPNALVELEAMVASDNIEQLPLLACYDWRRFRSAVCRVFKEHDYVILRGFLPPNDGAALLVAVLTIGSSLRTYRDGKVCKYFKMSPWTTELSHTTQRGEFHTDLNTDRRPPAITAIQCLTPDPGRPKYGTTRVARLSRLLEYGARDHELSISNFFKEETVAMLNDRSSACWSGKIVEADTVRYHPETIRAAARQGGYSLRDLEEKMEAVERAAMAVSIPFALEGGDVLLLSNHRTLHYRGECSVVFRKFPTEFESRRIAVLHAARERSNP